MREAEVVLELVCRCEGGCEVEIVVVLACLCRNEQGGSCARACVLP